MSTSMFARCGVLVAFSLVAACGSKGGDEGAADETQPVIGAEMEAAKSESFVETVGAIGTVTPRPGRVAILSAPAPTRVASVHAASGQHVRKGEALIELDQTGFQAAVRSAEVVLATAQSARERAQRLVDQGIAARKDLEQADADLARARADVSVAQRALELSTLRAPFDGVVTRMLTVLGASVDPSVPLVEVADPSTLDVLLNLSPTAASRIHLGNRVSLGTDQHADHDTLGVGEVADIGGMVDSASGTVLVRVRVNKMERELRIGETLFGDIIVATHGHAVTVPIEALVPEGDGFKVFVVDSADVATGRVVMVGGRTEKRAQITKGLAAGERVVTYGAFGVEDGAKIVPVKDSVAAAKP